MASDDGNKDGRFSLKEIHQYLLQGVYPSSFSKSDKQALRKNVNGADLYYTGRGKNLKRRFAIASMSYHIVSLSVHTTLR